MDKLFKCSSFKLDLSPSPSIEASPPFNFAPEPQQQQETVKLSANFYFDDLDAPLLETGGDLKAALWHTIMEGSGGSRKRPYSQHPPATPPDQVGEGGGGGGKKGNLSFAQWPKSKWVYNTPPNQKLSFKGVMQSAAVVAAAAGRSQFAQPAIIETNQTGERIFYRLNDKIRMPTNLVVPQNEHGGLVNVDKRYMVEEARFNPTTMTSQSVDASPPHPPPLLMEEESSSSLNDLEEYYLTITSRPKKSKYRLTVDDYLNATPTTSKTIPPPPPLGPPPPTFSEDEDEENLTSITLGPPSFIEHAPFDWGGSSGGGGAEGSFRFNFSPLREMDSNLGGGHSRQHHRRPHYHQQQQEQEIFNVGNISGNGRIKEKTRRAFKFV